MKTKADLLSNHQYGGIFENFIISEIVKNNYHFDLGKEYWFWRDSNGKEIDLLAYQKNSYQLYEIKAGRTIKSDQFKNMNYFEEISKSKVKKHLLYNGEETYVRSKTHIMNWKSLIHKK